MGISKVVASVKEMKALFLCLLFCVPLSAQTPLPDPIWTIDPAASKTDISSWNLSSLRIARDLNAPNGQYLLVLQPYTTINTGTTAYEKTGILIQAKTADPSTSTIYKDMVGIDSRGIISATNSLGRAWGVAAQGVIESGGDGYSVAGEFGVDNQGSDQPIIGSPTSKYVLHLVASGNGATAGISFTGSAGGFHKGIYMAPADIRGTHANDSFIELLNTWRVKKDGATGIGTGAPMARLDVRSLVSKTDTSLVQGLYLASNESTNFAGLLIHLKGAASQPGRAVTVETGEYGVGNSGSLSLQTNGGNVGIGVLMAGSRLHVAGGDVAISTQGSGVILKATSGSNCFRLTVDASGTLSTTSVTCP